MIAGEPERKSRAKRLKDGIPVDANTWQELVGAARQAGVLLDGRGKSPFAQLGPQEEQYRRSVAQPGSALAWGARGPEFKSRRSDQSFRASVFERMDTFMDTLLKAGMVRRVFLTDKHLS